MKIFGLILTVIVSLQADFVQTKTSAMLAEPQVSTGHMIYRAPDYMQWAYTSPQQLVWEIDGEQSRMIMSSVAGNAAEDPKLQKESKRLFREVNITMDESGQVARHVELIEKNGDTTTIEFTNVVTQ